MDHHALAALAVLALVASAKDVQPQKVSSFTVASSAFEPNAAIPRLYTCEGKDVAPPLAWKGVPAGTKSLALVVDDPDAPDPAAPQATWVHWLLYDIPPSATGLPEAVRSANLPKGTREGSNDWHRTGYGGPCPPAGRHRYFVKLYALDVALPDLRRPNKATLEKAMQGHVLAQAHLVGTYEKARSRTGPDSTFPPSDARAHSRRESTP